MSSNNNSVFSLLSKHERLQDEASAKKRRVEVDAWSEVDRFPRQAMALDKAITGSSPRDKPRVPFETILDVPLKKLDGATRFPSHVFMVVPSTVPQSGFPAVLEDESEILHQDPWVFEVLGMETNREEFILFLKTRLVGSKDQVFPGMDIGYFELGVSTMGPKAIWILSQFGITFAEQSHDMTPTENFVRTSRAPRFSYLHSSMHAKKGTAEYMAVRPFTDEAVRYHQLTARPQPSGRQQEVFNFAGYRDFNNELLQGKSSRSGPSTQPAPKGFFGSTSVTPAPFRRDPRSFSSLDPENVEYLYEKAAN